MACAGFRKKNAAGRAQGVAGRIYGVTSDAG